MRFRALAAAAMLTLGNSFAAAGTVTGVFSNDYSKNHLAAFDGTAVYDPSTARFVVTLSNITPAKNGGYLTSFAFDATGGLKVVYEDPDGGKKPNTNGFDNLPNRRGIARTNFGVYHAGAALDGRWTPGGANRGIVDGSSATFIFDVIGSNTALLRPSDLIGGGHGGLDIVATFKRLPHRRLDRVGGKITSELVTNIGSTDASGKGSPIISPPQPLIPPSGGGVTGTTAVPLPPALYCGLAVLGLGTLAGWRRIVRIAGA